MHAIAQTGSQIFYIYSIFLVNVGDKNPQLGTGKHY